MKNTAASYGERDRCPLYTAIQVIEGRWKPIIFQRLGTGALGFGELRRSMAGVTTKVLRQQLRQLESDGLITRAPASKPGHRVGYQLTPHGKTLGPVFECLWTWGVLHLAHMKGSQIPEILVSSQDGTPQTAKGGSGSILTEGGAGGSPESRNAEERGTTQAIPCPSLRDHPRVALSASPTVIRNNTWRSYDEEL
ncbi:MAG: helix-turn-helix transcriptional regulator [Acidobacteriaceae bacterium]|nr:helix-turn-helix transcriptional regulator [Acidobacteriaceae bacterium]